MADVPSSAGKGGTVAPAAASSVVSSGPTGAKVPAPAAGGATESALWKEVKAPKHEPSKTAWLLSFIDLTGILVGFFVLMFSTQVIDQGQWEGMTGSFKAAFAPQVAIFPVVPQGRANGYEVVAVQKDVLPYLDNLMRQRTRKDPLWQAMRGRVVPPKVGEQAEPELVYDVPENLAVPDNEEAAAAWKRMGSFVRGWKNPVAVRVTVADAEGYADGAQLALRVVRLMVLGGGGDVAAEVAYGKASGIQVVVKGE